MELQVFLKTLSYQNVKTLKHWIACGWTRLVAPVVSISPPTCFLLDLSTRVRVRLSQSTALVGHLEQSRSKAVFVSHACLPDDPIPHASPVPRPTVRGESRGPGTTHSLVCPEPFALPAFQRRFAPVAVCT